MIRDYLSGLGAEVACSPGVRLCATLDTRVRCSSPLISIQVAEVTGSPNPFRVVEHCTLCWQPWFRRVPAIAVALSVPRQVSSRLFVSFLASALVKVPARFLSPSKVRGGPITAIYGRRPVSDEAEIMVCLQEAVFPRILFNWLVSMGLFFIRHGLGLTLR